MAIEKVININVQGNADEAVGSLRSQLRAAQADVAALSEKFGVTSKEAIDAAKRAGELKDKIGDAKALTDAFNPDAKFKALSSSLAGVAGGFAAVQGGMTLFGAESKEVEKTLLKVQSAMALSAGLQQIGESIDSFKQLGAVIQNTTTFKKLDTLATVAATTVQRLFSSAVTTTATSFNTLKTAIVSTGIGALVVGLGFLIAKMNESSDAAEEMTEKQKELNNQLEYTKELSDEASKSIDFNTQIELANAKKRGASDEELTRIRIKGINERLSKNVEEINAIKSTQDREVDLTKEQQKRIQDLRNQNLDLQRKGKLDIANFEADFAEKQRQAEEKRNEEATAAQKKKQEEELARQKKHHEDLLAEAELFFKNASDIERKVKEDANQLLLDQQKVLADGLKDIFVGSEDEKAQKELEAKEASIKLAQAEAQAKQELYAKTASTASKAADLLGKNTAAGKALAIAAATINTYQGITAELATKTTTPFEIGLKIANVAIIAATGFKAVKDIVSVKVPGSGGGGAPSLSAGASGGSTTAPNFNVVGNSGVNQLAGVLSTKEQQPPIKTYVLANDVTTAQAADRNTIQGASIG